MRTNDFANVDMRKEIISISLNGEQCSGLGALVAKVQRAVTLQKLADQVPATVAVMLSIGTILRQLS